MLTLDWLLEHTTEDTEVIIRSHGPPLSAGELRAAVAAQAQALASRLAGSARSVVAVAQSDPARQLLSLLAAIEAGAVPMPLDARAPLESLIAQCTRARATLLIRDEDDLGFPEPASGPAPNIGLVLATSGSSGAPRAVALRSAGLRANVEAILGYLPVRRHGRTAVVLPFVSGYAVVGQAFTTLRAGGCLLLAAGLTWPAAQLDFLTALEADGLSSVPTSLRLLAGVALDRAPADRPPFRYVASAGAPLDPETAALVQRAFPAATLFNQYGLTEASPRVTAVSSDDPAFAAGSVGRALPGITLSVRRTDGTPCDLDELGEIHVRGPSNMAGYVGDPDASDAALTAEGGLRTGDIGRLDASGALFVCGRNDDLVKVAGERVSLAAVSTLLMRAPGVDAAFTCGVADPRTGTRLVAFVASSLPPETLLPALRRFARSMLSPAARPTRWIHCAALPHLLGGKIDRRTLQAWAEASAPEPSIGSDAGPTSTPPDGRRRESP